MHVCRCINYEPRQTPVLTRLQICMVWKTSQGVKTEKRWRSNERRPTLDSSERRRQVAGGSTEQPLERRLSVLKEPWWAGHH